MNSTNVSEESDVYSEGEDHVDVESDVTDSVATPEQVDIRIHERLQGDVNANGLTLPVIPRTERSHSHTREMCTEAKCGQCFNNNKDSVHFSTPNSISINSKSAQSCRPTKPATRPSFLITDILSSGNTSMDRVNRRLDTSLDSESGTSVATTPCTPSTPSHMIDIQRTAALLAAHAQSSPSGSMLSPESGMGSPAADSDNDEGR